MLDWDHQLDLIREHSTDATGAVCANKVCIISLENGSVLTSLDQDNTFNISNDEAKIIADAFKTSDFTTFKQNGVNIEGKKFKFISATDENIVFAKEQYVGTLTMQCSLTTILVAFTLEGYNQANTNLGLREIADYLSQKEGL